MSALRVRDADRLAPRRLADRLCAGPGDRYLVALAGEDERPELALAVGGTRAEAIAAALVEATERGARLESAAVLVYTIEGEEAA